MSMVIDTMVMAYALVGETLYGEECWHVLQATPDIWVPDSIRPELVNVIFQWVKFKNFSLEEGLAALEDAESLFRYVIPTDHLWKDALHLAVSHGQAAYDTLFVALAVQHGLKLITYDKKLLDVFPEYTLTAKDYLDSLTKLSMT